MIFFLPLCPRRGAGISGCGLIRPHSASQALDVGIRNVLGSPAIRAIREWHPQFALDQ